MAVKRFVPPAPLVGTIDLAAVAAAGAKARAEEQRVEDQARAAAHQHRLEADPVYQLHQQVVELRNRQDALEAKLEQRLAQLEQEPQADETKKKGRWR